ncbi:MAG: hypothetical protein A3F13_02625 [Gammaproteobacteria bacterium RIFCSPHIGHO2_12_FULL_40_19]|nr:MAG: hypothetical protein A3F13_02625 [Gammaproteobacteria bacterium RIFCSPHIGHO2_12_FULL_40_19]
MKKYILTLVTLISISQTCDLGAIQIIPAPGSSRRDIEYYNNYNMQQEQMEMQRQQLQLQRRQVRAQEDMFRYYRIGR